MDIRCIARELGISRNTVRRYLTAARPEMIGTLVSFLTSPPAIIGNTNGHFP